MNRIGHQPKTAEEQPATPHMVRRAIRYRAADNAREAIRRQYPSLFTRSTTPAQGPARHA